MWYNNIQISNISRNNAIMCESLDTLAGPFKVRQNLANTIIAHTSTTNIMIA